jgi:hypothetical protein
MSRLLFHYSDGGRAAGGYRGKARDCATRAIAIATGRSYADIYRTLAEQATAEANALRRFTCAAGSCHRVVSSSRFQSTSVP